MKDPDYYLNLAEDVVRRAKAHGADDADVLVAAATEFESTVRQGEIERLIEASSRALGLRVQRVEAVGPDEIEAIFLKLANSNTNAVLVENDTIFFFEPTRSRMRSVRQCLGFSWIDVRRKSCQSLGQVFD